MKLQRWEVKKGEESLKLIDFLEKHLKGDHSNREIKKQVELGKCTVNGKLERFASKRLQLGDIVIFDPLHLGESHKKPVFDARRVLFEDEAVLVYNKPPGVASDEAGLIALLKPKGTLFLTHRLDKDTSGVILLAKTEEIAEKLMSAFKEREVEKEYLAIVAGCPKEIEGVIENYLGKIGGFAGQTLYGKVPRDKGLSAKTVWRLAKAAKQAAVLRCFPETGRTHQIRVHLSEMGYPILGDLQYGKKMFHYRPERMLLHASKLTFPHPVHATKVTVEAALPHDFKRAYDAIWQ